MKILLFIAAFFVLCTTTYYFSKSRDAEPEYCRLVKRLQNQHGQEMQKEGYALGGIGGELCANVEKIYVRFFSRKTPTIEEVRRDYVKGVERFLTRINNDEAIRPYLNNYPFDLENLHYSLSYPESPVDASGKGPVAFAFSSRGYIHYAVHDPALIPLQRAYDEPYEEALRIVREEGGLR